jgi:hypothetical protein
MHFARVLIPFYISPSVRLPLFLGAKQFLYIPSIDYFRNNRRGKGLIGYGSECNVLYLFTLKRQDILKAQEQPHFHVVYTILVFHI